MHKVSPTEYCYIYHIYNTDRLCAPFFLNYFESEWFYRDGPFTKNIFFGGARKNVIYSKLVNNPFKAGWVSLDGVWWVRCVGELWVGWSNNSLGGVGISGTELK